MKRPIILTEIKEQGRGFISKDESIELLNYVSHLESKDNSVLHSIISESDLCINGKSLKLCFVQCEACTKIEEERTASDLPKSYNKDELIELGKDNLDIEGY